MNKQAYTGYGPDLKLDANGRPNWQAAPPIPSNPGHTFGGDSKLVAPARILGWRQPQPQQPSRGYVPGTGYGAHNIASQSQSGYGYTSTAPSAYASPVQVDDYHDWSHRQNQVQEPQQEQHAYIDVPVDQTSVQPDTRQSFGGIPIGMPPKYTGPVSQEPDNAVKPNPVDPAPQQTAVDQQPQQSQEAEPAEKLDNDRMQQETVSYEDAPRYSHIDSGYGGELPDDYVKWDSDSDYGKAVLNPNGQYGTDLSELDPDNHFGAGNDTEQNDGGIYADPLGRGYGNYMGDYGDGMSHSFARDSFYADPHHKGLPYTPWVQEWSGTGGTYQAPKDDPLAYDREVEMASSDGREGWNPLGMDISYRNPLDVGQQWSYDYKDDTWNRGSTKVHRDGTVD